MSDGWKQTQRSWGNDRTLRGVVHYMLDDKALCGYRPHASTTMVPVSDADNARSCETCVLRSGGYLEGRRW